MKRAGLLGVCVALSTCTGWEIGAPPARFSLPTSLGTQLPSEGSTLRQLGFKLGATSERAVVMVQEGAGLDRDFNPAPTTTHWYSVDATMAVRPLAEPPFAVDLFWPTAVAGNALVSAGSVVQTLDSHDVWTQLSANVPVNPEFLVQGADGRIFARGRGTAFVWDAPSASWKSLTDALALPDLGGLVLGPVDATFARIIWQDGHSSDICTQKVELATLTASGARTCKSVGNATPIPRLLGDAVNGTVDDFELALLLVAPRTAAIWHFSNEQLERGNSIRAMSLVTSFADADAVLSSSEPRVSGQLMRVRDGKGAGTFFSVPGDLFAECLPPACRLTAGAYALDAHLTAHWFLSGNEADARRTLYLKRVPFDPAPLTCTPACKATEVCVHATASLNVCAIDESLIGAPTFVPATVRVETFNANGVAQPATLTLALPDGGVELVVPRLEGTTQTFDVPQNTPLRLTMALPNHATQTVDFTSANEGVMADLGQFRLGLGARVGRKLGSLDLCASSGALITLTGSPQGAALQRVRTATDGGIEVTELLAVDPLAVASGCAPDGGLALVGEPTRLHVTSTDTGVDQIVTDPGSSEPWFSATFSRDGTSAAVERQSGFTVVSLNGTPSLRYSVRGPNQANRARLVQLSNDGSVALATKIGPTLSITSMAGEVTLPDPGGLAALSGDGQWLYLTAQLVPPFTLSARPTTTGGTTTQIATNVSAWAIDPDGADVWFTTATSPMVHQLQHWVASTGTATVVMQLNGVVSSLPRAGALWAGSTLYYPVSAVTPRALTSAFPDSVDAQGRLQAMSAQKLTLFTPTSITDLSRGPGLFRGGQRRMNGLLTIDELLGTSVLGTAPFTNEPQALLAPAFTTVRPVTSIDLPFGVYTQPARTVVVDSQSGVASWTVVGADVFAVP
ncbi:MAG: hypothetical protein U0228_01640 [Myxococcaceae bacterium]